MPRILFLGDVVGRVGRGGVRGILPKWADEHHPDLIVANVENVAHGKGVTVSTLNELRSLGVTLFTGGNHMWDKPDIYGLLESETPIARPANYPVGTPGKSYVTAVVNGVTIAVASLMGVTFMPMSLENPFITMEGLLNDSGFADADIKIVDFHAEATAEKVALGWFLDGRVHAVLGTHTHVPTADESVLLKGTLYQTDIGMCGAWNSVIGVEKEGVLKTWLTQIPNRHLLAESGKAVVNAVLLDVDSSFSGQHITRLQAHLDV